MLRKHWANRVWGMNIRAPTTPPARPTSNAWLLWKVPALRGRVAYDIRFELLTDAQWQAVRAFRSSRPGWQARFEGPCCEDVHRPC